MLALLFLKPRLLACTYRLSKKEKRSVILLQNSEINIGISDMLTIIFTACESVY